MAGDVSHVLGAGKTAEAGHVIVVPGDVIFARRTGTNLTQGGRRHGTRPPSTEKVIR